MLNNIKSYGEGINEAAATLPKMPAFLKAAGAKEAVDIRGPYQENRTPTHWVVTVGNMFGTIFSTNKEFTIAFYPNGTWEAGISPAFKLYNANMLSFNGKYKALASAKSNFFGRKITGVEITSTNICVPKIRTYE